MSRFLFVVLPLAQHANASLALGQAVERRGHEVAWCGPESYLRPLVGPGASVYPTGLRLYREQADYGQAAVRSLWQGYLIPFNLFILASVNRAVVAYRPDVLVVDQHALAGALVAYRHGLPWASLVPAAMELTRPLRGLPDLGAWVDGQIARLWAAAGLTPDTAVDLRFSPYLVLAATTSALTGQAALPDRCVLVGPMLGRRAAEPDFAWDWLDPRRQHVLVTVGTLAQGIAADFYARAVRAVAPLADRLQAVVVGPAELVPDPPSHVLVVPRVPMLDLMPHVQAVICHAGMGTVGEALAHGVPLVLAPIRHDQPVVAEQVVAAGAGIEVPFATVSPQRLRAAVTAILDEPTYRAGAQRVRDSFAAAGGAAAAARHLDHLVVALTSMDSNIDVKSH